MAEKAEDGEIQEGDVAAAAAGNDGGSGVHVKAVAGDLTASESQVIGTCRGGRCTSRFTPRILYLLLCTLYFAPCALGVVL